MSDDYFVRTWCDQLADLFVPHIINGFTKLYHEAKKMNPYQSCKMFQMCLSRIPSLSLSILDDDYQILLRHGCDPDWLHQMIVGIFATYAKLNLVSHGADHHLQIHKKDLEIPDNITFLHKCYIESARQIWSSPYLFSDKYDTIRRQENLDQARSKIKDSVQRSIMKQIPFQRLYRKYHHQTGPSSSKGGDDYQEDVKYSANGSDSYVNELKQFLDQDTQSTLLGEQNLNLDLNIHVPYEAVGGGGGGHGSDQKHHQAREEDNHPVSWVKRSLKQENINRLQNELVEHTSYSSQKSQLLDKIMRDSPKDKPVGPIEIDEEPVVEVGKDASTYNLTIKEDKNNGNDGNDGNIEHQADEPVVEVSQQHPEITQIVGSVIEQDDKIAIDEDGKPQIEEVALLSEKSTPEQTEKPILPLDNSSESISELMEELVRTPSVSSADASAAPPTPDPSDSPLDLRKQRIKRIVLSGKNKPIIDLITPEDTEDAKESQTETVELELSRDEGPGDDNAQIANTDIPGGTIPILAEPVPTDADNSHQTGSGTLEAISESDSAEPSQDNALTEETNDLSPEGVVASYSEPHIEPVQQCDNGSSDADESGNSASEGQLSGSEGSVIKIDESEYPDTALLDDEWTLEPSEQGVSVKSESPIEITSQFGGSNDESPTSKGDSDVGEVEEVGNESEKDDNDEVEDNLEDVEEAGNESENDDNVEVEEEVEVEDDSDNDDNNNDEAEEANEVEDELENDDNNEAGEEDEVEEPTDKAVKSFQWLDQLPKESVVALANKLKNRLENMANQPNEHTEHTAQEQNIQNVPIKQKKFVKIKKRVNPISANTTPNIPPKIKKIEIGVAYDKELIDRKLAIIQKFQQKGIPLSLSTGTHKVD